MAPPSLVGPSSRSLARGSPAPCYSTAGKKEGQRRGTSGSEQTRPVRRFVRLVHPSPHRRSFARSIARPGPSRPPLHPQVALTRSVGQTSQSARVTPDSPNRGRVLKRSRPTSPAVPPGRHPFLVSFTRLATSHPFVEISPPLLSPPPFDRPAAALAVVVVVEVTALVVSILPSTRSVLLRPKRLSSLVCSTSSLHHPHSSTTHSPIGPQPSTLLILPAAVLDNA